jgi:hypothetical protein
MTRTVTVYPENKITNYKPFMCPGSTFTLNTCLAGGKWYSSNPVIADIDSMTGVMNALTTGTVTISYTTTNPVCPGTVTKVVKVGVPDSMRVASPICVSLRLSASCGQ